MRRRAAKRGPGKAPGEVRRRGLKTGLGFLAAGLALLALGAGALALKWGSVAYPLAFGVQVVAYLGIPLGLIAMGLHALLRGTAIDPDEPGPGDTHY